MTHNPSTGEWYYSKTGWIEILRRLLYGLKSITQEELSSLYVQHLRNIFYVNQIGLIITLF